MKRFLVLLGVAVVSLSGFLTYQYVHFNDGKLHVIFCNVGQGDAILLKTPSSKYILVDAGPDKSVLNCLGRHMPLWKREIDLALLTHPHLDHFMGYHFLMDHYRIKAFATEQLVNTTPAYELFVKGLHEKKIPQQFVVAGDAWDMGDGVKLTIVGPSQSYLESSSPGGNIGETKELASLITLVTFGAFRTLLTGDSQEGGLEQSLEYINEPITVLQAPHHGSASGLNENIVQTLAPESAAISVGKNKYGHPTEKILNLLKEIPVRRTDEEGDVEYIQ